MIRVISYLLSLSFVFAINQAQAEKYVIGVEDLEYYPIYAKREGEYAGFARELLDMFADASGHTFEYKILPIKRLYNDFLDQKFDLKFPDSSYWQADAKKGKNVIYSDPVLEYIDGVLVAPGNLGKGLSNLKTLGSPRGFSPYEYLDDVKAKKISLKEGNTLKSLLKMAESNRIDGVYFNIIVARYFLEHTTFNDDLVIFDKGLPHTRAHYHLSTIKHPELMKQFNDFLANNKAEVATLKAKYNVTLN